MNKIKKIYNDYLKGMLDDIVSESLLEDLLIGSELTFSGERCYLIDVSLYYDEIIITTEDSKGLENVKFINLPIKYFLECCEIVKYSKLHEQFKI